MSTSCALLPSAARKVLCTLATFRTFSIIVIYCLFVALKKRHRYQLLRVSHLLYELRLRELCALYSMLPYYCMCGIRAAGIDKHKQSDCNLSDSESGVAVFSRGTNRCLFRPTQQVSLSSSGCRDLRCLPTVFSGCGSFGFDLRCFIVSPSFSPSFLSKPHYSFPASAIFFSRSRKEQKKRQRKMTKETQDPSLPSVLLLYKIAKQ